MPVKKISDAPANIRELDEAKLTLAQINYILRIYDALKEEGEVESPMAVAIAQFKEAYRKEGDKWVKKAAQNTASGSFAMIVSEKGASMLDLENLERYIVINTGAAIPPVEDLRELEGDYPAGVYALWSDDEQTIVAFVFEPNKFDEEGARAWIAENIVTQADGTWPAALWETFKAGIVAMLSTGGLTLIREKDTEDVSLRGFNETRLLVQTELDRLYVQPPPDGLALSPWILEMGPNTVVFEYEGRQWAAGYSIDESDVVMIASPVQVAQEWVRPDGSTIMLFSLRSRMGDGAEAGEDDGLVWKEIVRPGKFFKTNTGAIVEITADIINSAFEAWRDGLPQYISVPTDSHHGFTLGVVPPEHNKGFVEKLKLIKDRLFGAFRFTDAEIESMVYDGSIVDCSVYLRGNVHHPESGERYPWILQHVLLTNDPLVQGLGKFGQVPAAALSLSSGSQVSVQHISLREVSMSQQTDQDRTEQGEGTAVLLTAQDVVELEQYRALGAVEELTAVAGQRDELAQRARELRITEIVAALEGSVSFDGIVQVDERRHYPVVVAAAETILRAVDIADVMAAGDAPPAVDGLVIQLLNAIPADARLEVPPAPARDRSSAGDASLRTPEGELDPERLTDESIDELDAQLQGSG